jgi:hypothetical protein
MPPNLIEIEQLCYAKAKNITHADLFKVAGYYYENFKNSVEYKDKLGNIKKAGYFIDQSFKKGLEGIEELNFARQILINAAKFASFPQPIMATLSKVTKKWLVATGNINTTIIQSKKIKLNIETGMLVVFSKQNTALDISYNRQTYIDMMAKLDIFACGLGQDFSLNLKVRFVDSSEPVLTAAEYSKLEQSTLVYNIQVQDGLGLNVGDGLNSFYLKDQYNIKLENGTYKICLFNLKNGKYILVFSNNSNEQLQDNEIIEIPSLE